MMSRAKGRYNQGNDSSYISNTPDYYDSRPMRYMENDTYSEVQSNSFVSNGGYDTPIMSDRYPRPGMNFPQKPPVNGPYPNDMMFVGQRNQMASPGYMSPSPYGNDPYPNDMMFAGQRNQMGSPGYMSPSPYGNGPYPPVLNPMQAQMMAAGGNPNNYGPNFKLPDILNSFDGIVIHQKLEPIEIVTGLEMPNTYYVYERGYDGTKKGKKILKCKEKTNFCQRNCVPGDCRGIEMRVENLSNSNDICLVLKKKCQCTCCCFNKPVMEVFYKENGREEYLGKVADPWDCCAYDFQVYDRENRKLFSVGANCMQLGIWCKCPCQSCEKVRFDIRGADGRDYPPILKYGSKSCVKNMISDADRFGVPFAKGLGWKEKALLMSVALLIDYRMFETSPNNTASGRNNSRPG